MNLLDLEFLATGSERYRYPLEKNGHGRKQGRCKQERADANTFQRYPAIRKRGSDPVRRRAQNGELPETEPAWAYGRGIP